MILVQPDRLHAARTNFWHLTHHIFTTEFVVTEADVDVITDLLLQLAHFVTNLPSDDTHFSAIGAPQSSVKTELITQIVGLQVEAAQLKIQVQYLNESQSTSTRQLVALFHRVTHLIQSVQL